jgi:hypothetical protein
MAKFWRKPDPLAAHIPSTRTAREARSWAKDKPTSSEMPSIPSHSKSVELNSSGYFSQNVVGESFYTDNLKKVTRNRSGEIFVMATLIREPGNRFDRNAVRVDINGLPVGHIPKEDAVSFHALLDYANSQGLSVTTKARVWWDAGDGYGSVGLDVGDPDFALVINLQDLAPNAVVWPSGKRFQVQKESENFEAIKEVLNLAYGESGCAAFIEVRNSVNDKGKALIEIARGSVRLGELSPATGKKFMPVLERLQEDGSLLFMLCEITGNALAAEITILAKSPEDLTREELAMLGIK